MLQHKQRVVKQASSSVFAFMQVFCAIRPVGALRMAYASLPHLKQEKRCLLKLAREEKTYPVQLSSSTHLSFDFLLDLCCLKY